MKGASISAHFPHIAHPRCHARSCSFLLDSSIATNLLPVPVNSVCSAVLKSSRSCSSHSDAILWSTFNIRPALSRFSWSEEMLIEMSWWMPRYHWSSSRYVSGWSKYSSFTADMAAIPRVRGWPRSPEESHSMVPNSSKSPFHLYKLDTDMQKAQQISDQHPMLHRKAIAYANQQSEWIAHRMLISIGTYWAIYDWFAQLGHTLPHPILANWLILSPGCRCSSVSGTCAHWVGQKKSELNMKNIFKPILGGSPTSCSQHWMDLTLNVWITFFFWLPIEYGCNECFQGKMQWQIFWGIC